MAYFGTINIRLREMNFYYSYDINSLFNIWRSFYSFMVVNENNCNALHLFHIYWNYLLANVVSLLLKGIHYLLTWT